MTQTLNIGDKVPSFSGKNQLIDALDNAKRAGKYTILYFYPKDNTPGCTAEACSFRDNMNRLLNLDATVVGVSPDTNASHEEFARQHQLNFSLIADEEKELSRKFDVLRSKEEAGKTVQKLERTSFIIDPHGKIAWIERPVNVEGHVDRVIQALNHLKSR